VGFVPVKLGVAAGALERALVQAEQATTVHVIVTWWGDEGETVMEEWSSDDGFYRRECWQNGKQSSLTVAVGGWEISQSTGSTHQWGEFVPTYLHPAPPYDRTHLEQHWETLRYHGKPVPEIRVTEHREATLWGGAIDVVEAEWTAEGDHPSGFGGRYEEGTRILITAEIDPDTGRLLAVCEYKLKFLRWRQTYEATYEWDVEVPEELRHVEIPSGVELTRHTWWEERAFQVLAQADTRDWTVTLHAIDINRDGDVVLSLSRVERADGEMPLVYNTAPPLVVEGVGSAGEQYEQQRYFSCYNARHSGYWTTTLKPLKPDAHPRSLTLTIWPYPDSPSDDQSVTFYDVLLPPRQNVDDLFAAETEMIQY